VQFLSFLTSKVRRSGTGHALLWLSPQKTVAANQDWPTTRKRLKELISTLHPATFDQMALWQKISPEITSFFVKMLTFGRNITTFFEFFVLFCPC
jgi:hypothetical protein